MTAESSQRFAFGRNWQAFLSVLDEERIHAAQASLQALLGVTRLDGRRFLDIGCGSGLSSLVARQMGARVHSFDYDPQSVACTKTLRQRYCPGDADWTVEQGSALDQDYLAGLGQADVVYSWGVLHHTGAMWQAVDNVLPLVAPGGTLALAIYNFQGPATRIWTAVKRLYVSSPWLAQLLIAALVCCYFEWWSMVDRVIHLKTPLPFADWRRYKKQRGMSRWHDYVDWAGGYPFETSSPDHLFRFVHTRGFELVQMKTMGAGLGCNEFSFVKKPEAVASTAPGDLA
jgi:SAM-dependent methyltransferase